MSKLLLIEIRDLLEFETRQAKRHNLSEIRITVPRAATLSHAIREAIKANNAQGRVIK